MRRVSTQGLLLHTSSVHGVGLGAPLRLVHLTRSGVVAGHDVLSPRSAARAGQYWLLEVPLATTAPPIGTQLVVLPSSLR